MIWIKHWKWHTVSELAPSGKCRSLNYLFSFTPSILRLECSTEAHISRSFGFNLEVSCKSLDIPFAYLNLCIYYLKSWFLKGLNWFSRSLKLNWSSISLNKFLAILLRLKPSKDCQKLVFIWQCIIDTFYLYRVNCYDVLNCQSPFGGYKMSGTGREL